MGRIVMGSPDLERLASQHSAVAVDGLGTVVAMDEEEEHEGASATAPAAAEQKYLDVQIQVVLQKTAAELDTVEASAVEMVG